MKEAASGYGVGILRADVKDLVFPGNLQEIMNRVLAAERMSEAQLVEAKTKAEVQSIDAKARSETARLESEARAESARLSAESEARLQEIKTKSDIDSLRKREEAAQAYATHPALLRLQELEVLRELARSAGARLYVNFGGNGWDPGDKKPLSDQD